MIKKIFTVIIGLIVGNIAMMGLHYLSIILYPLPESIDLLNPEGLNNPEALKEYMKTAPFGALFCIMFAHISGAFFGGVSCSFMVRSKWPVYFIGLLFTLAGIYNLYKLPHPLWFNIEIFLYVPAALLGFKIKSKHPIS